MLHFFVGKYYLVENPHMAGPGFIAPYPGVRHRQPGSEDGDGDPPRNAEELFNWRHSSLRARMEHALGILKARFRFLTSSPQFPFLTQVDIVLVCCILHNMIIEFDPADEILSEYFSQGDPAAQRRLCSGRDSEENGGGISNGDSAEWWALRDAIAEEMWRDFVAING